jgi:hypothetical protein
VCLLTCSTVYEKSVASLSPFFWKLLESSLLLNFMIYPCIFFSLSWSMDLPHVQTHVSF